MPILCRVNISRHQRQCNPECPERYDDVPFPSQLRLSQWHKRRMTTSMAVLTALKHSLETLLHDPIINGVERWFIFRTARPETVRLRGIQDDH